MLSDILSNEMDKEELSEKLVDVINKMIECCEPIKYDDFNKFIPVKYKDKLERYEKENQEIGIATFKTKDENGKYIYHKNKIGISTLSIISTITDVLIGKRLAFSLEDDGTLSRVEFYNYGEK